MFTRLGRRIALSLCVAIGSNAGLRAAELSVPVVAFGSLKAASAADAREQTFRWLESTQADAATRAAVEAVWKSDKSTFDKVAESLALASPEAATLLAQAGDPKQPAPTEVPAILKDAQLPAFYRANLGLAYARALAGRQVHEEALDVLRTLKPQQVVDPASLLYYKAVTAHALMLKDEARKAIVNLLEDCDETPARYEAVARLMQHDIDTWKDQDLGWITRRMANIERRLELARGGPATQKMQREVVARLDEMIKKLEQQTNPEEPNGPGCPGNQPGPNQPEPRIPGEVPPPNSPAPRPIIGGPSGPGDVVDKIFKKYGQFGKLPHKERAEMQEALIRELPGRYRPVIEEYFKKLANSDDR